METILPLIYERLVTLADFNDLTDFFWQDPRPDKELLLKKSERETVKAQLNLTRAFLETAVWTKEEIERVMRQLIEDKSYKKSQYLMMIRVAVTGKKATPPLFETMAALEKETVLRRLTLAENLV